MPDDLQQHPGAADGQSVAPLKTLESIVLYGDALARLREVRTGSVQVCVTSPPYWGQRDYGTRAWFGGDESCDHDHHAVEEKSTWRGADGELIPARSCSRCAAWFGQVGLESTVTRYVANLVGIFAEVRRALHETGTLWLNLGDGYNAYGNRGPSQGFSTRAECARPTWVGGGLTCPSAPNKSLIGLPWMVAFALRGSGWTLRADVIWAKPHAAPERVTDRPMRQHENLFLFSKADRYSYDRQALKSYGDCESVWTIATTGYSGGHFATFPPELPERCIVASTRPGDLVLDPFAGSGTTLAVARRFGRAFIGIEQNEAYKALIEDRLDLADEGPPFMRL